MSLLQSLCDHTLHNRRIASKHNLQPLLWALEGRLTMEALLYDIWTVLNRVAISKFLSDIFEVGASFPLVTFDS